MNLRQKLYDAQDSANILLKINNSSALYRNLEKIQYRKPMYGNSSLTKRRRNNKKEGKEPDTWGWNKYRKGEKEREKK